MNDGFLGRPIVEICASCGEKKIAGALINLDYFCWYCAMLRPEGKGKR